MTGLTRWRHWWLGADGNVFIEAPALAETRRVWATNRIHPPQADPSGFAIHEINDLYQWPPLLYL
jgi:hypothetical protein